jgi:Zn-dependent protease with chaperone function
MLLVLLGALGLNPGGAAGFAGPHLPSSRPLTSPEVRASTRAQPARSPVADHYSLTPEKRAKAVAYSRARYELYFVGVLLALATYWLLWRTRVVVWFRNIARRASPRHFFQCLVFVPLLTLAVGLIGFPLDYYSGFALEHRFDLSTQGFASWLGDWGKDLTVTTIVAVPVVWILYLVIRRSPRGWWFYFWLITIPLTLGLILIEPVVIDPLFYKFTPLEKTQPALSARIQEMLRHAGLEIPRSRIIEMDASSKTKTLDAYVTGVGATKRVVVWDNTLRKLDEDETLLALGHETGHYALYHIPKEFALIELVVLALFYLGFLCLERIVTGSGPEGGVESMGDLASLPVALLVLTGLQFLISPVINGISRHYEHQADQFGLEVTYGVVPDPNSAEVRSLQVFGEEDLADPDPTPLVKFWLYSHPPLDERMRFAAAYKPWAEGKPLELVHPSR